MTTCLIADAPGWGGAYRLVPPNRSGLHARASAVLSHLDPSYSPGRPVRRLLHNVARGRGMEHPSLRPTLKRPSHSHWARVRLVFCTFSLGSLVPSALRSCTRATVRCFPPFPPLSLSFSPCLVWSPL